MRSNAEDYVIRKHRPYRCAIAVLISTLLGVGSVWLWLTLQYNEQNSAFFNINLQLQQTQDLFQQLESNHRELLMQAEQQSQELAMQLEVSHQLQQRLSELQERVMGLNKELLFYQNITQGGTSSELQIRELSLSEDPQDAAMLRYRLVITQGQNLTEPITGNVEIGLKLGSDKTVVVAEHSLNLRHVQVLEGSFALESWAGASVEISLKQNNKVLIQRSFEWKIEPSVTP